MASQTTATTQIVVGESWASGAEWLPVGMMAPAPEIMKSQRPYFSIGRNTATVAAGYSHFQGLKMSLLGGAFVLLQMQAPIPLGTVSSRVEDQPHEIATVPSKPQQQAIARIKESSGVSNQRLGDLLGVSRQTVQNWIRGEAIDGPHLRQLVAIRDLLDRARSRLGRPDQVLAWLDTPRGAAAVTPAQLITAGDLDRARLYAITSPAAGVEPPPAEVRRRQLAGRQSAFEDRDEPFGAEAPTLDSEMAAAIQAARSPKKSSA